MLSQGNEISSEKPLNADNDWGKAFCWMSLFLESLGYIDAFWEFDPLIMCFHHPMTYMILALCLTKNIALKYMPFFGGLAHLSTVFIEMRHIFVDEKYRFYNFFAGYFTFISLRVGLWAYFEIHFVLEALELDNWDWTLYIFFPSNIAMTILQLAFACVITNIAYSKLVSETLDSL